MKNNYFKELLELTKKSYAPYSKFLVAAIVVCENGDEYHGVNIDNSSFGATMCAERNAIAQAIANGISGNEIIEIHLLGKPSKLNAIPLTTPCGICRQVINEITNDNVRVYVYYGDGLVKEFNKEDLLPCAFTGDVFETNEQG